LNTIGRSAIRLGDQPDLGRNHEILAHPSLNSYLLASLLPFARKNFLTGRAELVDKDELFADQPPLEATVDRTVGSTFRIGA
jgi:hypothetical protein